MTMTYHPTKQTINTPTRREEKCAPLFYTTRTYSTHRTPRWWPAAR